MHSGFIFVEEKSRSRQIMTFYHIEFQPQIFLSLFCEYVYVCLFVGCERWRKFLRNSSKILLNRSSKWHKTFVCSRSSISHIWFSHEILKITNLGAIRRVFILWIVLCKKYVYTATSSSIISFNLQNWFSFCLHSMQYPSVRMLFSDNKEEIH